jgi:small-conductance mechanosensitive channel
MPLADDFLTALNSVFNMPFIGPLLGVLLILVVAVLVRWGMQFAIRRIVDKIVNGVKKRQNVEDTQSIAASPLAAVRLVQRTRTLGSVLSNVVTVVIVVIALLLILTTVNPDILGSLALLTAALGAGLGFGAQNIIKDVLNGLFMVAEDQLGVGDVVDTGFATGVVEAVGIRVTQVRDVNGTLWFVRNGEIQRVGNMSQGWARVIIDLGVPYEADVEAVQERMLATATELATSTKWRTRVLDKPEVWGLESISADAVVLRIVVKTRTSAKDDVARELRLRLKKTLDDMEVKLPSLSSVVLTGFEGAASVTGSRPPKTRPSPLIGTGSGATTAAPAQKAAAKKALRHPRSQQLP